ncbi:hypothetical protein [Calothrix rhizosoleniae]|uniref:hypothetical protein n=1 Tax=Calothrix rhizosoleniae TaxID=888997 RepID=UPI000B4A3E31|nr:hypothetical protein [Calothrix rhizosoleniae]
MTVSMQLMIADFDTLDGAKNAFKRVKQDKLKRGDVALLTKDENNKIKFKEILDELGGDLINYPLSVDLVNELKKAMESDEIKLDVAVVNEER